MARLHNVGKSQAFCEWPGPAGARCSQKMLQRMKLRFDVDGSTESETCRGLGAFNAGPSKRPGPSYSSRNRGQRRGGAVVAEPMWVGSEPDRLGMPGMVRPFVPISLHPAQSCPGMDGASGKGVPGRRPLGHNGR